MHKSFVSHYHEVSVPENYYKFRKYENLISFAVRLFVLPLTPFHQIAGVLLREELKKNFFSASLRLYLFKTYYANKLGFPIRFLAKKTDPGLCTSNNGIFKNSILFYFK